MLATPITPAFYRPTAPMLGVLPNTTSVQIGTGATAIADSTTTSVLLPKPTCTSCQLIAVAFTALIAAASSGGTVTMQVFKRDNSGTPADRTLTATKSIEADVVTVADATYQVPITATAIQNVTFAASDACRVDVVAGSAIQTAPVITIVALWAIITP